MSENQNKKGRKMAAALQYVPETDQAPRLIAFGEGDVADSILRVAKDNEIPLHQDQALVQLLSNLRIGSEIPEDAYQVVAEILAFVYRLSRLEK